MKTMKTISCALFVLTALFITASSLRAETTGTFTVGDFTFTRPAKWESVEVTSPMRKAQLKVPGAEGKSADVVFFDFGPGAAGGVKANVDRWLRQFDPADKQPKVEEATIGKTKVTYVQTEGTYHSGMPGGPLTPMPDYALMGAIMESDNGAVFVKMTGPKEVVNASISDFKKMIESGAKSKS